MTAVYVRRLFDQHAPAFDAMMRQDLDYRGPELLCEAVLQTSARSRFGAMLDLGCGTGLAGAVFRPYVDWLVGVDLSAAMIAQAQRKGLYDRLVTAELGAFLCEDAAAHRYDLVLAADVFVYVSDLAPMATAAAAVLAARGLFAFSVETHDGEGALLRETLRYAHSADHVREALQYGGLTLLALTPAVTRTEKGAPVAGLIAVALLDCGGDK